MSRSRPELSNPHIARLRFDDLDFDIEGVSVAGVETWLRIPQWSLAIDAGHAAVEVARCRHLAITHAHMDHAGGIGNYLALRRLYQQGTSHVYVPANAAGHIKAIVDHWQQLQGHPFDWHLHAAGPGDRFEIARNLHLEALPADHVIEALGYAVWRTVEKLKPEFANLSPQHIAALRHKDEQVTVPVRRLLLAVSGDTRISMVDRVEALHTASVSLIETTFLDERRSVERADAGGHIHLKQLSERAVEWQVDHLVPYHISQRYDVDSARDLLTQALNPKLSGCVRPLLPESTQAKPE